MTLLQLEITCNQNDVEQIEMVCNDLGASSITIGAADNEEIFEPELNTSPLWQRCIMMVIFENNTDIKPLYDLINQLDATVETAEVQPTDWLCAWKQYFKRKTFGSRVTICPSHEAENVDEYTIILDPGLAFGTGSHPTTSLCLKWLDTIIQGGETVIDYGCGSGILAMAAAKLGAKKIYAVDIDEQALQATQDNAKNNNITNIETFYPSEMPDIQADILIANILSSTLIELAPTLRQLVKNNGKIALSGILPDQIRQVIKACLPYFPIVSTATEQGENNDQWALLISDLALQSENDILAQ